MSRGDRYVVLGFARPRAEWFRALSQWATSAALPCEFLKCVSVDELRTRLASGRAHSAVLLDGSVPAVDREVIHAARSVGCPVFIVDDAARRDWALLGATAVLPAVLTREVVLDVLATHASMVGRPTPGSETDVDGPVRTAGRTAAVCGSGGTGTSTVAAALAQGLSGSGTFGRVLLADLALNADQAMLHDVRDVVPGLQELVEANRGRWCTTDEVRALTFHVEARAYDLLLGLRRARHWSTIRPATFEAAFDAMRGAFDAVVCDVTGDFEGEDQGGSVDVEERNALSRTAALRSDAVFVVGRPGAKGMHSLVRLVGDLLDTGVQTSRLVPVVNVAPRQPRARAEISAALADLLPAAAPAMASPIFLPARRIDEAVRDGAPMPSPLPALLVGAFDALLRRHDAGPVAVVHEPELVAPGSLGGWFDDGDVR